ncbi:MAG: restriction endonuclease subunit S [Methylobacter sp.]
MKFAGYPEYRDTGIQWVPQIPLHWDVLKLSHIVKLKSGESITSMEIKPVGDFPVYGGNGHRGFFDEYTHDGKYILIGRQGALCGNINYAAGKFWASEHAVVVTPDRALSSLWLGELLKTMNLGQYSVSAAQPGISVEMISRLKIPFPPIVEQQRISEFITHNTIQIDRLIEKKKALIEKLNEKRITLITQTVTKGLNPEVPMKSSGVDWLGDVPEHWHVKRLRFAIQSNPLKSEIDELERDDLVSFVPMDAVGEYGGIRLDVEKPLDAVYDGYTYFRDNDVVIAKITPCFENGKGARAEQLTNGVAFGTTELHVMRPLEGYSSRWLFYLSICHAFREIGASEMYGAGGQKRVPEGFIKNFRIGIPDFDEQESIADFIDSEVKKMDEMLRVNNLTIERLTEYRTALITAAVTGKIDVRGIDIPSQEAA